MTSHSPYRQQGFNLAELMVALTIGLLVTLAVATLFVTTRQDYRENDATANMQENARFAMELLTSDLRHSSFFGNLITPSVIDVDDLYLLPPTKDCGQVTATGKAGLYNFTQTRYILNFGNQLADATTNATFGTCFDASDNVKANSSVLLVKRVAAQPTAPLSATDTTDNRITGYPYIYSNGAYAYLYTQQPTTVPIANGQHWEYQPRIYFIDSNERLTRKQLTGASLVSEPLAEGISAFHIEFGIDTPGSDGTYDGAANYVYTPAANAVSSDATDINQAVSATIFVLARTTTPDPDTKYIDTKTYKLGSLGPTLGPFKDGFHRRVYSTTVVLKNIRNQILAN